MVTLVLSQVASFALPAYIGLSLNAMTAGDYDKIRKYTLWMLLVILASSIMTCLRAIFFNLMAERIARALRKDFFESMVSKDVAFYDVRKSGDLISRIGSDIEIIQNALSTNISMLVRSAIFNICVLIILFLISPPLAGVTLATVVPVIVFGVVYGMKIRKL